MTNDKRKTGKDYERMYCNDGGRVPLYVLFDNAMAQARAEGQKELVEEVSRLRGMLREVGRMVVERTGVSVTVCGGMGDAMHWNDVPGLVEDCLTLALPTAEVPE